MSAYHRSLSAVVESALFEEKFTQPPKHLMLELLYGIETSLETASEALCEAGDHTLLVVIEYARCLRHIVEASVPDGVTD